MQFTYKTTGPSSVPVRSHMNNGVASLPAPVTVSDGSEQDNSTIMNMPFKPSTMAQGSMFSNARRVYVADAGGGANWYSSSDVTYLKKITAIGKSSTRLPVGKQNLAYKSTDKTVRNSALARCRGVGCVAPKKKGAVANPFKGSGCCK